MECTLHKTLNKVHAQITTGRIQRFDYTVKWKRELSNKLYTAKRLLYADEANYKLPKPS